MSWWRRFTLPCGKGSFISILCNSIARYSRKAEGGRRNAQGGMSRAGGSEMWILMALGAKKAYQEWAESEGGRRGEEGKKGGRRGWLGGLERVSFWLYNMWRSPDTLHCWQGWAGRDFLRAQYDNFSDLVPQPTEPVPLVKLDLYPRTRA